MNGLEPPRLYTIAYNNKLILKNKQFFTKKIFRIIELLLQNL